MASSTVCFVGLIFLLTLVGKGVGQGCTLNSISYSQSLTGKLVQGNTEWKMTIMNDCKCTQSNLKLRCAGFDSVEAVDPKAMAKTGDECLINGGFPIPGFSNFSFIYARVNSFPFRLLSSQITC